jgi:hypothetical protein
MSWSQRIHKLKQFVLPSGPRWCPCPLLTTETTHLCSNELHLLGACAKECSCLPWIQPLVATKLVATVATDAVSRGH